MGKNKLKKFREMETIDLVFQCPFGTLRQQGFPMRGNWHRDFFHNDNPIILELGCGKGEYTVGLARRFPDANFIGIDIKGARMWTGACQARDEGLPNVAFLRTSIELLDRFFAPGEVAHLWITFPDPQMKKARKRLTGTNLLGLYSRVLAPGGLVNLKTDSPFLYTYTRELLKASAITPVADIADIHDPDISPDALAQGAPAPASLDTLRDIRTYYEQQWIARGLTIKYLAFPLEAGATLAEPDAEIPLDTYRSFSRGTLETMPRLNDNTK